jgi:hypothetical protein
MRRFVSEHRFRVVIALCVVALVLMTGTLHATMGLGLTWNASAEPRRG